MVFLRKDGEEAARRLEGEGVYLRHPELRDYPVWSALRSESQAFLQPWEPLWPADELSRQSFRFKLRRYGEDIRQGKGFPFFVFRGGDEALVGGVTLGRVQRGVTQSGAIGYWVGARYARCGYTIEGVRTVLRFAFEDLGLHRVEAACQPDNEASRRLLERVGFHSEGRAREYLKIDGHWRDHLLFGMLATDTVF